VLFSTTIRENIAFGKDVLTLEEIKIAAELANASKFIDKLPNVQIKYILNILIWLLGFIMHIINL
jgi:ABC-type multidrug transport system fused ATPase/permease subunit